MTKDEALREAIDTLKSTKHGNCDFAWIDETLKKCTEALAQPPLPVEWLLIKNILDEYGLQAIDFVAEFKAAQQVVGVTHCQCEACKNGNMFACKGRNYFDTYKAIEAKLKEKNHD